MAYSENIIKALLERKESSSNSLEQIHSKNGNSTDNYSENDVKRSRLIMRQIASTNVSLLEYLRKDRDAMLDESTSITKQVQKMALEGNENGATLLFSRAEELTEKAEVYHSISMSIEYNPTV